MFISLNILQLTNLKIVKIKDIFDIFENKVRIKRTLQQKIHCVWYMVLIIKMLAVNKHSKKIESFEY